MYDPGLFDPAQQGADLHRALAELTREAGRLPPGTRETALDHIAWLDAQVTRLDADTASRFDGGKGASIGLIDTLQHAWHDLAGDIARAERDIRRELSLVR